MNPILTSDNLPEIQDFDYPEIGIKSLLAMVAKRLPGTPNVHADFLTSYNSITINEQHAADTCTFLQQDFTVLEIGIKNIFCKYFMEAHMDFLAHPSPTHIYHDFITLHAMLFNDTIDLKDLFTKHKK